MKKSPLTVKHIALLLVAVLAVVVSARPYVRSYMIERDAAAHAGPVVRPGGGGGGGSGFDPQRMAAQRLEQISQQLKLTPAQKDQIKAIQDSDAPRNKAIFDDKSLSREQKREKMQPLRAAADARIKQILTPQQQTQYAAMQAQTRARWGGSRQGGSRGGANNRPGTKAP